MQEVFQELAVLLVILCAGAYFGKKGILNEGCISQMNKMVVKIAFPALVIASMDKDFTPVMKEDICNILQCAGLIHDIGNPPFGHFGETAIREWFEKNLPLITYHWRTGGEGYLSGTH